MQSLCLLLWRFTIFCSFSSTFYLAFFESALLCVHLRLNLAALQTAETKIVMLSLFLCGLCSSVA
jgi:hypothetical protein